MSSSMGTLDASPTGSVVPTDRDVNRAVLLPKYYDKDQLIEYVLQRAETTIHLKQLRKNYSSEKGFELPMTTEWENAIETGGHDPIGLLKYHNSRQLRFGSETHCLRLKDSLPYWSNNELDELQSIIDGYTN